MRVWFFYKPISDSSSITVERVKRQSGKARTVGSANVEFIHPKLREEMDNEPEDPENPWVWLTSYSRIPV